MQLPHSMLEHARACLVVALGPGAAGMEQPAEAALMPANVLGYYMGPAAMEEGTDGIGMRQEQAITANVIVLHKQIVEARV